MDSLICQQTGINPVQIAHRPVKPCPKGFHQQMVVVGHQDVAVKPKLKVLDRPPYQFNKLLPGRCRREKSLCARCLGKSPDSTPSDIRSVAAVPSMSHLPKPKIRFHRRHPHSKLCRGNWPPFPRTSLVYGLGDHEARCATASISTKHRGDSSRTSTVKPVGILEERLWLLKNSRYALAKLARS